MPMLTTALLCLLMGGPDAVPSFAGPGVVIDVGGDAQDVGSSVDCEGAAAEEDEEHVSAGPGFAPCPYVGPTRGTAGVPIPWHGPTCPRRRASLRGSTSRGPPGRA